MQETHRPPVAVPTQPQQVAGAPAGPAGLSSVTGAFRRPDLSRGGPNPRRLAGLAGWAAALGLLGLVVGVRGLVAILIGGIPGWYEPTLIGMGLVGIGLTSGAFLTVQRGQLPWILLGAGTAVLLSSIVATSLI
jgi:hypothetical protein